MDSTRRQALISLSAGAAALACGRGAQAQSLDALAASAAKGPPVVWYESSPEDQADQILKAFNARDPNVKVQFVRITGGNQLAARAVQETQARGYTADLLTGGADHTWELAERGILLRADFGQIGIPKALTPTDFAVAMAASVYVLLWNTNKVKDAEVPRSWEELNDPKWTGRVGSWVRAAAWAQLAEKWGKDKAEKMLRDHVRLRPFLFKSTFPMAQSVAAGEVDLAVGFYHTTQPPIAKGAPVKLRALDPTPMHTIYSAIGKSGKNIDGAKLLLAWLASADGNKAYEAATSRGSHLIAGTETAALLKGKNIAEWPPEKTSAYSDIAEEFNKILAAVGQAR